MDKKLLKFGVNYERYINLCCCGNTLGLHIKWHGIVNLYVAAALGWANQMMLFIFAYEQATNMLPYINELFIATTLCVLASIAIGWKSS